MDEEVEESPPPVAAEAHGTDANVRAILILLILDVNDFLETQKEVLFSTSTR